MTISEVNERAKFFSKLIWGKVFDIDVVSKPDMDNNGELSLMACADDHTYLADESYIFINSRILNCSKYVVIDILLHEMCHWSMYLDFKNNYDGCEEFELELNRLGISSTNTCRLIADVMYYRYGNIESHYRPTEQILEFENQYLLYRSSES